MDRIAARTRSVKNEKESPATAIPAPPADQFFLQSGDNFPALENRSNLNRGEQLFWFLMIGILSTIVDVGLLYFFTEYFRIWYLLSATASYCCGILISYCLNKFITFHDTSTGYFRQFFLFATVSISSLSLNLGILYILVDMFALHYVAGKGVAICISVFWNYFGQSRLTFRAY